MGLLFLLGRFPAAGDRRGFPWSSDGVLGRRRRQGGAQEPALLRVSRFVCVAVHVWRGWSPWPGEPLPPDLIPGRCHASFLETTCRGRHRHSAPDDGGRRSWPSAWPQYHHRSQRVVLCAQQGAEGRVPFKPGTLRIGRGERLTFQEGHPCPRPPAWRPIRSRSRPEATSQRRLMRSSPARPAARSWPPMIPTITASRLRARGQRGRPGLNRPGDSILITAAAGVVRPRAPGWPPRPSATASGGLQFGCRPLGETRCWRWGVVSVIPGGERCSWTADALTGACRQRHLEVASAGHRHRCANPHVPRSHRP